MRIRLSDRQGRQVLLATAQENAAQAAAISAAQSARIAQEGLRDLCTALAAQAKVQLPDRWEIVVLEDTSDGAMYLIAFDSSAATMPAPEVGLGEPTIVCTVTRGAGARLRPYGIEGRYPARA